MKLKPSLLLVILCASINTFGQNTTADSLMKVLNNSKQDTTRIKILIEIGDAYENEKPEEAIVFYNKAVAEADKTMATKKITAGIRKVLLKSKATSLRYMGIVLHYQGKFDDAIGYYAKSIKTFELINDKKGISDCYNNTGSAYLTLGNYPKAAENYKKSLEISEELGDNKGMSMCFLNLAISYKDQGNLEKAIEYNTKAFNIFKKLGDQKGEALYYNSIGIINRAQGKYEKAVENFIKSMKIKEIIGDKHGMAQSLQNIGNVYLDQEINNKALEYYTKSLKIDEELGNKQGIAICCENMASIHSSLGKKDIALQYHFKAVKMCKEIGNNEMITTCYINIGSIYQYKNDLNKAGKYYQMAISNAKEVGDNNRLADAYDAMAILNIGLAKKAVSNKNTQQAYLNKAVEFGMNSITLAHEMKTVPQENSAAKSLMNAYKMLGNYQKAMEYADIYTATKDSMFVKEKTDAMAEMEAKYQNDKKQKEIEILEKDKVISHEKAQKQKILIISILGGSGLLIFLITFILRRLQITRRQKRIIEEKNILLNEKNEEISAQSEEIASQRDNLEVMNIEITDQRDKIAAQHNEITASINYASRIQQAMLPSQEIIAKNFPEYFVLYRPCQIVSGDFYWFKQVKNIIYIVAADCTGHGIPGAFMSMLGLSLLNEIISPRDVNPPHETLNELRKRLKKTLHQTGEKGEQQDGMDIALCMIDLETKVVQFSGAYNPFFLVRNNELTILKGDRMPIGVYPKDNESFTVKEVQLLPNDSFYLFSDGYVAQTNGDNLEKFKVLRFKDTLLKMQDKPMAEQKDILESTFDSWKGNQDQVDDILVIGVRV